MRNGYAVGTCGQNHPKQGSFLTTHEIASDFEFKLLQNIFCVIFFSKLCPHLIHPASNNYDDNSSFYNIVLTKLRKDVLVRVA